MTPIFFTGKCSTIPIWSAPIAKRLKRSKPSTRKICAWLMSWTTHPTNPEHPTHCGQHVESRQVSVRELIVPGTSSEAPTRHRNHNGYMLRWDGEGLLFDPGEGSLGLEGERQLLLAGAPASGVTRLCLTHFHGDHCLVCRASCDVCRWTGVPAPREPTFRPRGSSSSPGCAMPCLCFPRSGRSARVTGSRRWADRYRSVRSAGSTSARPFHRRGRLPADRARRAAACARVADRFGVAGPR